MTTGAIFASSFSYEFFGVNSFEKDYKKSNKIEKVKLFEGLVNEDKKKKLLAFFKQYIQEAVKNIKFLLAVFNFYLYIKICIF